MVLPSYRAWLCCGVKTAVTGSVEDTLEPAANKSRFQSRYELLVQYLLYRADLESFLLTVFWPVNLEYISPIRATIEQPLISLTASLHLFMNFQDEWILLSLSLSLLHARSLSLSLDLMICWLVWHGALARTSSLYKCWQGWPKDVPDGTTHMQFALWPGRLMNRCES